MNVGSVLLLVVAGVAAGLSGSIAGLASLFSYPALLAVGLAPVTANVTNTVGLVFNSVGSVSGSRPELASQWGRVRRLAPAGVAGGIAGGALLLLGPAGVFERIVPWLIAIGSLTILVNPRPPVDPGAPPRPESKALLAGTFLIGVYGGYFGAAAGVLLLALLLAGTSESLAHSNAVKNVVLGGANAVAAVIFAVFGSVDWAAAIPLAIGLFIGGHLGPAVVRRSPARPLRIAIALAGLGLAGYLGLAAYT